MTDIEFQVTVHAEGQDATGAKTTTTTAVSVPADMTVGEMVELLLYRREWGPLEDDPNGDQDSNWVDPKPMPTVLRPQAQRMVTVRPVVDISDQWANWG